MIEQYLEKSVIFMCDKIESTMFTLGFFTRGELYPELWAIDYLVTVDNNNAMCVEDW